MKRKICLLLSLCIAFCARAEVRLPQLVRDSMVLQRDAPINIWGWASKGEKITISFNKRIYKTEGGNDGKWMVQLKPLKAGGPYVMDIRGTNHIVLKDILVGDVWICSGQSNMVHQMALHRERYEEEIKQANNPLIRQFGIPTITDLQKPREDLPVSNWKSANPRDVLQFSAVAYFFAQNIFKQYGIPIGLINSSVGGPPIEAWINEEGLKAFPQLMAVAQRNKDSLYIDSITKIAGAARAAAPKPNDKGLTGSPSWYSSSYVPKGWHNINLPGYWEDQGLSNLNGIVWYRKEIDVPASMTGVPAKLTMGRIVDADFVYINGTLVGSTSYQYPQRRYNLAEGVLKAGKNTIVIKVINQSGKGGFVPDKPYHISAGGKTIDLKGDWQYKVGDVFEAQPNLPAGIQREYQPSALYNAMIAPLTNYTIKGILWYQGEGSVNAAKEYEKRLPVLINSWRKKWGQGDVPFLFVQLPNFGDVQLQPSESAWAELREGQRKSLSVPNTGMAVAIDLGEWNDIHPDNKKDVGVRLALAARKLVYGEKNLVASGPLFKEAKLAGNRVTLSFNHTGSGLKTIDDEAPNWFAVAGADKKFVWAVAKIEGDQVVLWHDRISDPKFVRYAWADNPLDCNLYNKEGLPASPFEVELPGTTAGNINSALPWNNKQCAVLLTYDDGLNVHLSNAVPALDSLGLKGTFYISDYAGALKTQVPKWKLAALNGHELANHTMHHPCEGGRPGREFVKPENDLTKYTVQRITSEIKSMNTLLASIDNKRQRTFAFPCADAKIGDTAYIDYSKNEFIAARSVRSEMPRIEVIDLFNLPSYMVNGESGEKLIGLVKEAMQKKAMLIFLFHGVGGEHSLNVSLQAHTELLQFLKQNERDIWIAPVVEVASYIKTYQQQATKK
ncbi:MAG TPA: sialate O-acetylesterase [Chitinophagaceae bacterium]|nr:sialate O-acetylesterase [Chitinophagaceae bacterium]